MTVSLDTLHRTNFELLNLELAVSSMELYVQAAKISKVAGLRIKVIMASWKDPRDSNPQTKIAYFDYTSVGNIHQLTSLLAKVPQSAQEFVQNSKNYGIHIFTKIVGENKQILSMRGFEIINAENINYAKICAPLKEGFETPDSSFN